MTGHDVDLEPRSMIGLFATDQQARLVAGDRTATDVSPLGRAPWSNADPHRRVEIERAFAHWRTAAAGLATGDPFQTTFDLAVDGRWRAVRVTLSPRHSTDGTLIELSGAVVIDEIDTRDEFSRLARRTSDAVLVVDLDGGVAFANPAVRQLVDDDHVDRLAKAIRDQMPRALLDGDVEVWRGETVVRDRLGDRRTLDCTAVRTDSGSFTAQGFTVWCRDITSSMRLNAELAHQATHDALTGLPNRQLFLRRVAEAVERARVDNRGPAVLYLDIDNLKNVNDSLGHDSGDVFIATVGRRLSTSTRPGDVVGRIGGDEFVVLCEGVGDDDTALDLAERVKAAVADPVVLHGTRIATGVSIGIAVWRPSDDSGSSIEAALDLVRRADTAMYRAKARGKGRCEAFSDAMRDDAQRRVRLGDDLERALADDQLHLVFQPIVATHSGRVEGAEALLRWQHPTDGLLTPSTFLDLAEESGLVIPIGSWVIDESARRLARWIADGRVDRRFRVHVNVSARQLIDAEFVEDLTATVGRHGLAPANFCLEHGAAALTDDEAIRTLHSLYRLGFLLAVDDFGDSHTSLGRLRACPSQFVKLHGSFVRPLGEDDHEDPMVRGVIQLLHGLDRSVIASWVGSADQMARLRALGCDLVQGFHVSRPVSADDFDPSTVSRLSD